jgi:pimeloyl-ACP methyl ester carboxylesterase
MIGVHRSARTSALEDAEITGIEQPTLMVYGTADPVGSVEIWRRFVGLMPRGELEVVDAGGHLVWYNDPSRSAVVWPNSSGRSPNALLPGAFAGRAVEYE